jgi:hypothetical protein
MSNEIGSLRASLSANAARFETDMQKAKEAVRKNAKGMSDAMDAVGKKFNDTIKAINRFGAVTAMAAATGLALFIKKQIDAADAALKEAQAVGTTVETLTAMLHVADRAGVSHESLIKALAMTAINASNAAKGTGEAVDAYSDLKISVADAHGKVKDGVQLWMEIADKFKNMEDGAYKTSLAAKAVGKAVGPDLVPMFNLGSAGIRGMMEDARQLGRVLTTKTALEAAYLKDQLELLQQEAIGTGQSFALRLVPWLVDAVKVIKTAKEESGTLMAAWVALGSVGHAVFGKSLQQEINDTRERLEMITELQKKYEKAPAWQKKTGFFTWDYSEEISELKKELAALEAQQVQADEAEKTRMNASLARARKEAEEKRKYTEEIIRQAEARIKAAQLSAEEKAAEEARIREAKAVQKAIEDQIAALKFQAETYGKTTTEITLYRLELMGANAEQMAAAKLALDDIAKKETQAKIIEEIKDEIKAEEDAAKSFYESTRTPAERYNATIAELKELLAARVIDMDLFSRASQQAWEDMQKSAKKTKDESKGFTDDLKDAFTGWANNMSSTLNDVLWDSNSTFEDIATSFGKMITQMIIQTQIIKPLMANLFGGEGGSGGWMGSLFGSSSGGSNLSGLGGVNLGSLLTGLIGSIFEKGGVTYRGQLYPMASGAIVTGPTIFPMAQGYGLMGESGPEAVMPLVRTSGGDLGVKTAEGAGKGITIKGPLMVINTPNADSFRKAQGQIMAEAAMALQRGQRNL